MPGWKHAKPHRRRDPKLRALILKRDPICRCAGCHRCTQRGECTRPSTEADHVTPQHRQGTDDPANMRGICTPCHAVKSGREGRAARGTRMRAEPKHPGLL